MDRYRALLLGITDYDNVRSLPFLRGDLDGLEEALGGAGYDIESAEAGWFSPTQLLLPVSRFIGSGRSGDRLLVWLSGHGVHKDDVDYLVPSDADPDHQPLEHLLLPVESWGKQIDECPADIVFMIDACREGFEPHTMAFARGNRRWGTGRIAAAAGRGVAHVFACLPGKSARFTNSRGDSDEEKFSVFSRAMQQVISAGAGTTLTTLADLVRDGNRAIAAIYDEHRLHGPPQEIGFNNRNRAPDEFVIFPRKQGRVQRDGESRWRDLANDHPAWRIAVSQKPGEVHKETVAKLRAATVDLVGHLWRQREATQPRLAEDPWDDPEFGPRMTERVQSALNPMAKQAETASPALDLSPAEAALLVAGPFLHDTFWAVEVSGKSAVRPDDWPDETEEDPQRVEFRRFAQGYPRLRRRAEQSGDPVAPAQLGWWLLHRWVDRRLPLREVSAVAELLPPPQSGGTALPEQVFVPDRLARLLRELRRAPGTGRTEATAPRLDQPDVVAPGTGEEMPVRERLVGYLLAAGRAMAIEASHLPEILVEHIGTGDPVSLADLHSTIREARWLWRGATRDLRAECTHPAVELALRSHVEFLDHLLTEIHESAGSAAEVAPLSHLYSHATAEQVRPASIEDGVAYRSAGVRFHLAEDRVQELLMGESLYPEPGLAIRELYQNALDACRYRSARHDYLDRSGQKLAPWHGRISFRQGTDARGRPYLECSDNGVGMGMRELTAVFSQAGSRFVDTPEFLAEHADWQQAKPPVELFPNSRFGIGVLSYFMLADEITVDTCQFDRETGEPGEPLRVSIAGPGTLFRIRPGPSTAGAGTTVRLHLRADADPPSCVDLLRRILWVAEFHTEASHGDDHQEWLPGQLSTAAPLGTDNALREPDLRRPPHTRPGVLASPGGRVWWCDAPGATLVDGIWLTQDGFGAVVDLRDRHAPRLSVNRTQVIDDPRQDVAELLRGALPGIAAPDNAVLTHAWLVRFAAHRPALADEVLEAAVAAGWRSWPGESGTEGLLIAGCFPPDEFTGVLPPARWQAGNPDERRWTDRYAARDFTGRSFGPLAKWRTAAWVAAGAYVPDLRPARRPAVIQARPTDALLLSGGLDGTAIPDPDNVASHTSWLAPDEPVALGHLVAVAVRLSWRPGQVADRLRQLGYSVPDHQLPAPLRDTDPILMSLGLDGVDLWLHQRNPVALGHLIAAAHTIGSSPARVADRLRELGFTTPDRPLPSTAPASDDPTLVSSRLDGRWSWLSPEEPVALGHIVAGAVKVNRTPALVADRLSELGFPVPDCQLPTTPLTADDVTLVSLGFDSGPPRLDPSEPVGLGHLVVAAVRLGWPLDRVACRLRELGYPVPDEVPGGLSVADTDRVLITVRPDPRTHLDHRREVELGHLLAAAVRVGWRPERVADRLRELGFRVPGRRLPAGRVTNQDLTLISHGLNGGSSWLSDDEPAALGHLIAAAVKLDQSPQKLAQRLRTLGYQVPEYPLSDTSLASTDVTLVSRYPTGLRGLWLDPEQPVTTGHVLAVAATVGDRPGQVADRLRELGFRVSDHRLPNLTLAEPDLTLLSRDLGRNPPWLEPNEPVASSHIVAASLALGWSVAKVLKRLDKLGFNVGDGATRRPPRRGRR